MDEEQVLDGKAPFDIPSIDTDCWTYYKIFGDLRSGKPPVVVIHGGPGSGHDYLLAFAKLWSRYRLPVVFYDQIGVARSTHLRHKKGDKDFWTMELMVKQLHSLLDYLHLRESPGFQILGHSYGGMLGSYYATQQPKGLNRLILANAPASIDLHLLGLQICAEELPADIQEAFKEAARTDDYESQGYQDALLALNKHCWCRADPFPEELQKTGQNHADDWTVTGTMWGRAPHDLTGSLKGWNCFPALSQINVPTLLYHGEFDIEREVVVAPYVAHIPGIRKVTISNVSHMSHLDNTEKQDEVLELVASFLSQSGTS